MKGLLRPVTLGLLAYMMGIFISGTETFSFAAKGGVFLVLSAIGLLLHKRRGLFLVCLALMCAVAGNLYAHSFRVRSPEDISHVVKYYRHKKAVVRGFVAGDVQKRPFFRTTKTQFVFDVEDIRAPWGWQKRSGKMLVQIFRDEEIAYGDRLRLEGKIHKPFVTGSHRPFSYRDYLKNRGIFHMLSVKKTGTVELLSRSGGRAVKAAAFKYRNRFKDIFDSALTENESGIIKAILLGDRTAVPKPVHELFVRTGTVHILAISGLHVGIVGFVFLLVFRILPLPRKAVFAMTLISLAAYALLTGLRPSVLRATIMMGFLLTGFIFDREGDVIQSLSLAAFLILLANPFYLFDLGFQLSFICVLSIVLMRGRIDSILQTLFHSPQNRGKGGWGSGLRQSLSVSIAVWVGVVPMIAYHFQIVTPITIFANLIVIPVLCLIVPAGLLLLVSGVCLPALLPVVSVFIKVLLNILVACIFLFSKIPYAGFFIPPQSAWHAVAYYVLLGTVLAVPFGKWAILRRPSSFKRLN